MLLGGGRRGDGHGGGEGSSRRAIGCGSGPSARARSTMNRGGLGAVLVHERLEENVLAPAPSPERLFDLLHLDGVVVRVEGLEACLELIEFGVERRDFLRGLAAVLRFAVPDPAEEERGLALGEVFAEGGGCNLGGTERRFRRIVRWLGA